MITQENVMNDLLVTSPTERDCLGSDERDGPSDFHTAFSTARELSWNNSEDFSSLTKSSTVSVSTAAALQCEVDTKEEHYENKTILYFKSITAESMILIDYNDKKKQLLL